VSTKLPKGKMRGKLESICYDINREDGGRDRMVVRFTTAYVISAYHHCCYVFESRSGRGVQHYVIKFASDLRQVSDFIGSTGLLHQ
jgi:hypothetical protein